MNTRTICVHYINTIELHEYVTYTSNIRKQCFSVERCYLENTSIHVNIADSTDASGAMPTMWCRYENKRWVLFIVFIWNKRGMLRFFSILTPIRLWQWQCVNCVTLCVCVRRLCVMDAQWEYGMYSGRCIGVLHLQEISTHTFTWFTHSSVFLPFILYCGPYPHINTWRYPIQQPQC